MAFIQSFSVLQKRPLMIIRTRYDACVEVEREIRAMPYGPSRRSPFKRKRWVDASTLPESHA